MTPTPRSTRRPSPVPPALGAVIAIVAALVVAPSSASADELNTLPEATTGVASPSSTAAPAAVPGDASPADPVSADPASGSDPDPAAPAVPPSTPSPTTPAPTAPAVSPGPATGSAGSTPPSPAGDASPDTQDVAPVAPGPVARPGESAGAARVAVAPAAIPSSDAALAVLAVHDADGAALAPAFSAAVHDYRVVLPAGVSELVLEAVAVDIGAAVDVAGHPGGSTNWQHVAVPLGGVVLPITVTAADGTTTDSYRVTVERTPSDDTRLAWLTAIPSGVSPEFDADTLDYEVSLPNWNPTLWLDAQTADPAATASIEVDGAQIVAGRFVFAAIALPVGRTVVTVTTTAEDDLTVRTYTVTVIRAAGTGPSASPSAGPSSPPSGSPSATTPATDPSTTPATDPSTGPATDPSTGPATDPSTGPATDPSPSVTPSVDAEETTAPSPTPSSGVDADSTEPPAPARDAAPRALASTGSDALLGVLVAVALIIGGLLVTRGTRGASTGRRG